jgi:preprotein translocase subunit SecF
MLKVVPDNVNIGFIAHKNKIFAISLFIVVGSILLFFTRGLNYGIDFKGGYVIEVRFPTSPVLPELRKKLSENYDGEVSLQQFGSSDRDLVIKLEKIDKKTEENTAKAATSAKLSENTGPSSSIDAEENVQIINKVKATLGSGVVYRKVETIGPTVGAELVKNAMKSVIFAILAIIVYIAFRFEWQFAVCGLIALAQDCIGLVGAFSLFNLEFKATAIEAILTTASYSINDSIVIFDRIRENIRRYRKMSMPDLVNKSINETLSRTVLTAGSTLLGVLALCLFGGSVILSFSLPILIGISLGTFSSIALSAPLLLLFKIDRVRMENKGPKNNRIRAVQNEQ